MERIKKFIKKRCKLLTAIIQIAWKKRYPIYLDYEIHSTPRYGYGLPPHRRLSEIISAQKDNYAKRLSGFLQYRDAFDRIALNRETASDSEPAWVNGWFPPLDAITLYGMLASTNPKRYFEVGSGNSTKVARRAILDQQLDTKITSIDPFPRAEIDSISDKVIRKPVEDVPLEVFEELQAGDILLVDSSHQAFQNSDVTVCFLDILPMLPRGVEVAFHDILLPLDYDAEYGADRHYTEQYLLAAYILAEGTKFDISLPNAFIADDEELQSILYPIWEIPKLSGVRRNGSLFWIRINK